MASIEYGIFNDEGCIERGFWFVEHAQERAELADYTEEGVTVRALCGDHDEQPADSCEVCNTDEDDEDDA